MENKHENLVGGSDFKSDKLDKLVSEQPELAVLRFAEEVRVEVEGNITLEDNRFDAPYQEGTVTGGDRYVPTAQILYVGWSPKEIDLELLKDLVDESESAKAAFELIKNKVLSEPKNDVTYNLLPILSMNAIERLEEDFLKEFAD